VQPSAAFNEIHRIEAVIARFGEQAIDILEDVASNPETIALVVAAARIAGLPLTPGIITGAAVGIQSIEAAFGAGHQHAVNASQQQQPAPPQQPAPAGQPVTATNPQTAIRPAVM
jgi:hypothetical protein